MKYLYMNQHEPTEISAMSIAERGVWKNIFSITKGTDYYPLLTMYLLETFESRLGSCLHLRGNPIYANGWRCTFIFRRIYPREISNEKRHLILLEALVLSLVTK